MGIRAGLVAVGLTAVIAVGAWHYTERTRVIDGTWMWMFEGSDFFENRQPGRECELYQHHAGWLEYDIRKIYPDYSYKVQFPSSGSYRNSYSEWRLEAFEVRFVGHKRLAPLGAGHMRSWAWEYVVDRMLSVKPIGGLKCHVH